MQTASSVHQGSVYTSHRSFKPGYNIKHRRHNIKTVFFFISDILNMSHYKTQQSGERECCSKVYTLVLEYDFYGLLATLLRGL